MNKRFKMMTAVLTSCLVFTTVLAGCSTKGNDAASPKPTNKAQDAKQGAELPASEITMAFFTTNSQTKGIPAVEAELNKLTKAKINATVKLVPISYGSYSQQLNLMMASNEKLDLFVAGVDPYASQVSKGMMVPMDEMLAKYGSNIKKYLDPSYIEAARVNGKVYGITGIRDSAADIGIVMRKDLVDKYKIDLSKVKTYDDLDPVFKAIKDNEQGIAPLAGAQPSVTAIDSIIKGYFDNLGDSMGVLSLEDDNLKVVNMYETKRYTDLINTARRWYNNGFIAKDAATTKDVANDLIKANRAFSYFSTMKPGFEQLQARITGKEMVSAKVSQPIIVSNNLTRFIWSIAKNSKDPERAMMFLDLMYSDKDIINLLAYGIEGTDYVKKSDNMIELPAGVTATTVPYGLYQGWLFGNQFLSYVFSPDPADIWQQMDKFNKSAVKSKALGFSADLTALKSESAAVTNVINSYKLGLQTGTLDPQTTLPEFNKKLKEAGMDKIIAEKQKQLDEWIKTKK